MNEKLDKILNKLANIEDRLTILEDNLGDREGAPDLHNKLNMLKDLIECIHDHIHE